MVAVYTEAQITEASELTAIGISCARLIKAARSKRHMTRPPVYCVGQKLATLPTLITVHSDV